MIFQHVKSGASAQHHNKNRFSQLSKPIMKFVAMRKYITLVVLLVLSALVFGQPPKKTRNVAKTDAPAVSARKVSVDFTSGLKSYYSGHNPEALKVFNGILLDNPKHDPSYFMLSKIYTDQKNYADAKMALQQAMKLDKKNVWYKVNMAKLLSTMGDDAAAAKLWEQICKEVKNNEYYLYALAECYLNLQKTQKVIETYNRMEQIMGTNDEITRVKASLWLYINDVKSAVGEYDALIAKYPHNADYYIQAGIIYQSNNMLDKAYDYYAKALEITPADPQLNMALASYWEQKHQPEKVMECIARVFNNPEVPISEKQPYMRSCMAAAVRSKSQSDIQRAANMAETLIQTHPTESEGYVCKARLNVMVQRYAEALPLYDQALKLDNTSFALWEDYFYVISKLNQYNKMLQYEEEVQELFPQNAAVLYQLGLAYLQEKNADKAIDYLKQALALSYESDKKALVNKALGDAYHLKGDEATADAYWRKSKKM